MKFLLFTAFMMHGGTATDPVSVSQAWQEFPSQEACVKARDTLITGDRIIDNGLTRIAITRPEQQSRQERRREGTCIPAE